MALISEEKGLIGTYFSNIKVYDVEFIERVIKELEIEIERLKTNFFILFSSFHFFICLIDNSTNR
jgi:hypothetical protein